MRRHFRGCAATLVLCCAAIPAIAANPALKRVVLSSGGVGYFEYEAPVEGDATVTLDVPLDQVDDVLKSLVIYDSGGTAGEVTLPGREPLAQSFADLPFDPRLAEFGNRSAQCAAGVGDPHCRTAIARRPARACRSGDRNRTRRRRREQVAGQRHDAGRIAAGRPAGCRGDRVRRSRIAASGRRRADPDRLLSHVGPAAAQPAYARRRGAHAAARLCRRDAAVEGLVPAQPAGRSAGGNGPAAGLGGAREFQRPALAGCRADPAFRRPGHVPPGALRKLLCEAADGTGRSRRPDAAAARYRHRCGRRCRQAPARDAAGASKQRALQAPGTAPAAGRCRCPPPQRRHPPRRRSTPPRFPSSRRRSPSPRPTRSPSRPGKA